MCGPHPREAEAHNPVTGFGGTGIGLPSAQSISSRLTKDPLPALKNQPETAE
jgi:hypothetical protein